MKTIAALQAWDNFSKYYAGQVGETIKDKYDLTVTFNNDVEYLSKFDIVWSFFPQYPLAGKFKNLVKTFWEYHEGNNPRGKITVTCSKHAYNIFKDYPNCFCVPMGVNMSHFYPQPMPEGKMKVGWCGMANNMRKRFMELEAMMATIPEVDFVTNKLFHSNFLPTIKYKTVPEVNEFYKDINVYVCSSAGEGFGLTLLEATACGRPIVTFDVGIAPELRASGAGVIIVDDFEEMRDTILDLSRNPDEVQELGRKSSKAVFEKWQWKYFKDRWLEVFDKALE